MAVTCRTPYLHMQNKAEHSEHPKPEELTQYPALSREAFFHLLTGLDLQVQEDWGNKVGFGKILEEGSAVFGKHSWGRPISSRTAAPLCWAGSYPPTLPASVKQRGEELPQPPNWAFWPWTHCDLCPGMGSPAGSGSHSHLSACH